MNFPLLITPAVYYQVFSGDSDSKGFACNVRDLGSIPESQRAPGEVNVNPLQYSCLENFMDRGDWQATVHGVTESDGTERLTLSLFYLDMPLSWHLLTLYVQGSVCESTMPQP